MLGHLAGIMQQQLARYPTSLEEDKALLEANVFPFGSNRRNALVLVYGEKVVCQVSFCEDICSACADVSLRFSTLLISPTIASPCFRAYGASKLRKSQPLMAVEMMMLRITLALLLYRCCDAKAKIALRHQMCTNDRCQVELCSMFTICGPLTGCRVMRV